MVKASWDILVSGQRDFAGCHSEEAKRQNDVGTGIPDALDHSLRSESSMPVATGATKHENGVAQLAKNAECHICGVVREIQPALLRKGQLGPLLRKEGI